MAHRLCEDVLERILYRLIDIEHKLRISDWSCTAQPVILAFMLVGRPWLEVGRRCLYGNPDLSRCMDAMSLFQGSLMHLRPTLGGYVRFFDTVGIGCGPVVLSRMIGLMDHLQILTVESLDFVNHAPRAMAIPCLAVLEVVRLVEADQPVATKRRSTINLLLDETKLRWIHSASAVRLRGFSIFTERAIAPPALSNLRTLVLDRCHWDQSTYAEIIPQLASRLSSLQVLNFGSDPVDYLRRRSDTVGEPHAQAYNEVRAAMVKAIVPSLYILARQVHHLVLEYAHHTIYRHGPDLGLLASEVHTCEVDHRDSEAAHSVAHRYPPNTKTLTIKVEKLDNNLLRFIRELQKSDFLIKLETYPKIWIRAPSRRSLPSDENPPISLPVANPEEWEAVREMAMSSMMQRGLEQVDAPEPSQNCRLAGAWYTIGPTRFPQIVQVKYRNFWCWPFSLAPVDGPNENDLGEDNNGP